MAIDFISTLNSLGLTESEAKIYVAGLELGPSSVQQIAKKAEVSRTAAYDAIEGLKNRGLLSTFQKGKKTLYTVSEPDYLVNYLKEKKQTFNNQVDIITRNIGDLRLLTGGEKPVVKLVSGKQAVYYWFELINEKKPKKMYEISNINEVAKNFSDESFEIARRTFAYKKINTRFMYVGTATKERPNVDYLQLDKKDFGNFHGDITVYRDTIVMITFSEGANLIEIENKVLAETMWVMMDNLWRKHSKKSSSWL